MCNKKRRNLTGGTEVFSLMKLKNNSNNDKYIYIYYIILYII